jgi:tetratricopeptide (TPR) repeat protein
MVLVLFLGSCETAPEEIPEGLSQMEMFQRAQEASDRERYDTALRYYQAFIQRYPEDRGAIAEAEYEIAFIAYKQERYSEAQERFEALLADYETDGAGELPEWPRVLSEKLLVIVEDRMAQQGALGLDLAQPTTDEVTADGAEGVEEDAPAPQTAPVEE